MSFSQWHIEPSDSAAPLITTSTSTSSAPIRAPRLTDGEKLDVVLQQLGSWKWTIGKLLHSLFERDLDEEKAAIDKDAKQRKSRRSQYVSKFLSGKATYTVIDIVALMFDHPSARPQRDRAESEMYFSTDTPANVIAYARPALTTWALEQVTAEMRRESNYLVSRAAGLRVRASRAETRKKGDLSRDLATPLAHTAEDHGRISGDESNVDDEDDSSANEDDNSLPVQRRRRKVVDETVSWDVIGKFTLTSLEKKYRDGAPVTWHIIFKFMETKPTLRARAVREYRPKHIVCTSIISEMAYGRNQWANLFPLCRGISLFAMKAHHSLYGVGSRLGHNPPYSTVRRALIQMAHEKRAMWAEERKSGVKKHYIIVLDNIQAYARRRDHRIGTSNKMIIGTGATAVEMEDCPEGAFDLQPLLDAYEKRERKNATVESILDSIDEDHIHRVGSYHWLSALVSFVPALAQYQPAVAKLFEEKAQKHQINPRRHSTVHPLGTNSESEVTTRGLKRAIEDFLGQIGITEETVERDKQFTFATGDGKTYDGANKVKKYLNPTEKSDFKSLRCVEPGLEIWHTKWTKLSAICRQFWGKGHEDTDPSTLGFMAKVTNSPVPSDLTKVDFYANFRLVDLSVRAHMVGCWEVYYNSSDLPRYFETLVTLNKLPSLAQLLELAKQLYHMYGTSSAHARALQASKDIVQHPGSIFPIGPSWEASTNSQSEAHTSDVARENHAAHDSDSEDAEAEDDMSKDVDSNSGDSNDSIGDRTLANVCLLLRDGTWLLEVCQAVACGDTGRVWEIFKLWIFTFAGSGNSNYTTYLLELFCKLTYEYPEATRIAYFNNWLVNLSGKPGKCCELDLMQEHFNFWLEELAQHKGKEFDDEWGRDVLSMHVHHFLRLKEEMEAVVQIEGRRKTHTAPHLDNEFLAALQAFREHDLHRYREGRDLGHHATDDLAAGITALGREGKLTNYIDKVMRERGNMDDVISVDVDAADASTYLRPPMQYENGRLVIPV